MFLHLPNRCDERGNVGVGSRMHAVPHPIEDSDIALEEITHLRYGATTTAMEAAINR